MKEEPAPGSDHPRVSIVIPAYDAEATLGETLDSLLAQTFGDWEAIVVDDGSRDGTASIAASYAARDRRIRVHRQVQGGEGAARNAGVSEARGDWLLFLDADDWITPVALERYLAAAGARVDAVIAGWARVLADGTRLRDPFRPDVGAIFETLARFCPFAIHACLVSRQALERAGAPVFATDLAVGADWDFWQRVARAGARFVLVDEVLALYRVRPGSAVTDVRALLAAGRRIIALGHSGDPRVAAPDPRYADGAPADESNDALFAFLSWPAGMLLGSGGDPREVLATAPAEGAPELEPRQVAHSLFLSARLPGSRPEAWWRDAWPELATRIEDYLHALEVASRTPALARRALRILEALVASAVGGDRPVVVGGTVWVPLEITASLEDLDAPADAERALFDLRVQGEPLGTLELPVIDGRVLAGIIADAATDQYGWTILGRFLARDVYPSLKFRPTASGTEVRRGKLVLDTLASPPPDDASDRAALLHARIGWHVFLQELLNEPTRPLDWFYGPDETPLARVDPSAPDPHVVEVSRGAQALHIAVGQSTVELRAGGALVTIIPLAPRDERDVAASVGAITLPGPSVTSRASCISAGGYELARVAIREALVGRSWDGRATLVARLGDAAAERRARAATTPHDHVATSGSPSARWEALVDDATVLARRTGPVGTSLSRRAHLPAACADALRTAARAAGEEVAGNGELVIYAPDRVAVGHTGKETPPTGGAAITPVVADAAARPAPRESGHGYDRHYFETVFAAERDPWSYATGFERRKYEQTLELLVEPGGEQRVLELACAEGAFTARLAPLVQRVLATDISAVAVERTAARCASLPNVETRVLDMLHDAIPTGFDAIVCSEVLYYVKDRRALARLARRLVDALPVGGRLVATHSTVLVDDPSSIGLDWDVPFGAQGIGEVLAATPGLAVSREIRTPYYRVQCYERVGDSGPVAPPRIEEGSWEEPAPHVAARYRKGGNITRLGGQPEARTYALPILMYHSVAPEGPAGLSRYRVTPERFEEQLRYLAQAGFHGVNLDDWRRAKERWEPLPGRAVLITFDDGYRDFADFAWPLLRRYGFGAMVFLVTDHVGATNAWDAARGEPVPLMDWATIRQLQSDGATFGAHSASHPFLTACTPAEVVDEAARARATLARELGRPASAFAYPHGAEDPAVQHLVGGVGYTYALSTRPGRASLTDPLLALPRIEVEGDHSLADFIAQLGA